MRVLGRYLFPLFIAFVSTVSFFYFFGDNTFGFHEELAPGGCADCVTPASGTHRITDFTVLPVTIDVGGTAVFHVEVNGGGQSLGGEYYEWWIWQHCPSANPDTCARYSDGAIGQPDRKILPPYNQPSGPRTIDIGMRYTRAGTFNPFVVVWNRGPAGEYGLYAAENQFNSPGSVAVQDLTSMDVTPDDGTPSGAKSSESNNGGPTGPQSVQVGSSATFGATFAFNNNGPERGYKFTLKNSNGTVLRATPNTGSLRLGNSPQTVNVTWSFSGLAAGQYTVCAWGAQEDGLNPDEGFIAGKNRFLAWLFDLIGVANAAYTGVGASDQECRPVTVGAVSVKLYARDPNTGSYNDVSVSIPSGSSTTLKWDTSGVSSCSASSVPTGYWSGSKPTGTNQTQSTGNLTESVRYILTCDGVADDVIVYIENAPPPPPPPPPPPSGNYDVDAAINDQLWDVRGGQIQVTQGATANLKWDSSGTIASCRGYSSPIDANFNDRALALDDISVGITTRAINETTTYTVRCWPPGTVGTVIPVEDTVTAYVARAARVTLRGDGETGTIYRAPGTPIVLEWVPRFDPTRCFVPVGSEVAGWSGEKSTTRSSTTVSPTQNTTYRIRCENAVGGETATLNVVISNVWVTLLLNGGSGTVDVPEGNNGLLTWTTGSAVDECRAFPAAQGWTGSKSVGTGSTDVGALTTPQAFTIECREWVDRLFLSDCDASTSWSSTVCNRTSSTVNANIIPPQEDLDFEVDLKANVNGGAYSDGPIIGDLPLNNVGLRAYITNPQGGDVTYTFFCDRTQPGDLPIVSGEPSVPNDEPCDYSLGGTFYSKVNAQKGSTIRTDEVTIIVNANPINITGVTETLDYCSAIQWRHPEIVWTTSGDAQASATLTLFRPGQSAYVANVTTSKRIQIPGGTITSPGTYNYTLEVQGVEGGTDIHNDSFSTFAYQGPRVRWTITDPQPQGSPPRYPIETQIFFDNTTTYFGGSNYSYLWEYDNEDPTNAPANSTSEDGNAIYTSIGDGNKRVRLTVFDGSNGQNCWYQNRIQMGTGLDLPIFREIIPR